MTDTTDTSFVPPAADGLPAGSLEAASIGAARLDAWAWSPNGRNFLAHALVQLARAGWLRTEPGEGFERQRTERPTPEPQPEPAADPFANGVCTYGEDQARGAGCIKPTGHDGAHCVVPGEPDED